MEGSKIKDIYQGDLIAVWGDNDRIFVDFYLNGCTLSFTSEDWEAVKSELQMMLIKDVKNVH